MKKYAVTTTENLRSLCIRHKWFTCGTNAQYEKLFYANEHGCSIEEIATIIWLCSDDEWCRRDILDELKLERLNFWKGVFGVENEKEEYQVYDEFGIIYEGPFEDAIDLLADPNIESLDSDFEDVTGIYTLSDETVWERSEE